MSIISDVTEIVPKAKEPWDTVKSILDNKNVAKRMPRIICQISALVLLFSYLQQYWDLLGYIPVKPLPPFDNQLSGWLVINMPKVGCCWLVYHIVVRRILCWIACSIDVKHKTTCIVYFKTIDDVADICASTILFLYSIDELLYLANFGTASFRVKYIYVVAAIYLFYLFLSWVHNKNSQNPYALPTDYYDCKNKRIFEKDYVTYYNKLYQIHENARPDANGISREDPYVLSGISFYNNHSIRLGEAAKDDNGKLTVIQRDMI